MQNSVSDFLAERCSLNSVVSSELRSAREEEQGFLLKPSLLSKAMNRFAPTIIQVALLLVWVEHLSAASATYWRLTLTQLNPSGLEYYFYEIDFFNPSSSAISGTYSSNRGGLIPAL
jgi:hypothetical protein